MKVLVALRVPGIDVHEVIQVHRRYLVELMQQWTRLKEDEAEYDLGLALVVDAELFRLDSVVRWLDAADGRHQAGRGRPGPGRPATGPRRPCRACGAGSERGDEHAGAAERVEDLRQGATEVHALQDVDLSVEAGAMVAVMGPSGSGKSTLLTIAGSLEDPTSGEVLIGGAALSRMSRNDKARLRRRSIGYVFQDFNLLPGLTAVENVSLPLELDGVPGQEGARRRAAGPRRARPGRAGGQLPRRAVRRRAPAGGDRPRGGGRAPPAARRRALRRAGLGERRGGHAAGARGVQARRGRGGGDPRRAAGLVGRPGRVPARRPGGRPDRARGRARSRCSRRRARASEHRTARTPGPGGNRERRRARPPRGDPLGVADVPPRVAPAAAGPGAHRGRGGRHRHRGGGGHEHAAAGQRRLRHRPGPGHVPAGGPQLASQIAALQQRFGRVDVIENQTVAIPGSINTYDLRAQNPNGPFGQPMLSLVSGHYPAGPGQVAVTDGVAPPSTSRSATSGTRTGTDPPVVGIVQNPQSLLDEFALVVPGQVSAPTQVTVLFDAHRRGRRLPRPERATCRPVDAAPSNALNPETIVLALATVGMLLIALVAVGGFTVLAQRRLRSLGMLGALGATDRNVRLVVLANGVVVGVVGALIGAVVGLAAWLAYRPRLERAPTT